MQYVAPVCVPACPVRTADRLRAGRQMIPKIDTGIAQKGHLWMDTNPFRPDCRELPPGFTKPLKGKGEYR